MQEIKLKGFLAFLSQVSYFLFMCKQPQFLARGLEFLRKVKGWN